MKKLAIISLLALSACATDGPNYETARKSEFTEANYAAADHLIQATRFNLDKSAPLLIGTLANIDKLDESSRLGRLVSEQLSTRFTQQGFNVVEMKLRNSVQIGNAGEMILSRDTKDLSKSYNSQVAIAGTYAVASGYIYVTLKAIAVADGRIVGAWNYQLPITGNTQALLAR